MTAAHIRIRMICAIFLGVAAVSGCTAPATRSTRPWTLGQSNPEQRDALWRADLAYLVKNLPARHKNAFFHVDRQKFEQAAAELDAQIPELQDEEVVVGLMRLVALLGDRHTGIHPSTLMPQFQRYPLALYWFSDGIFVTAATPEHSGLLGTQLVRIGHIDMTDAAERLSTAFPHENEATVHGDVPRYAATPEVLHALRLIDDPNRAEFTFRTPDGRDVTTELEPLEGKGPVKFVGWHEARSSTPPLCYRNPMVAYWYELLPQAKLLYIKYNRCAQDPNRPFGDFVIDALGCVDRGKASKVVVDLRHNGGGNSMVMWPLTGGLKSRNVVNQRGHLFVIIGRATFSSGQLNANELRKQTNAIVYGEPTGQKPNAYGEIKLLELPNSGLKVSYSTKYFETGDDEAPSMEPDVTVEVSSSDYFAGRDPVLEAILRRAAESPTN